MEQETLLYILWPYVNE